MTNNYRVYLTNFGYDVYCGNDYDAALVAAKKSGLECSILQDYHLIGHYSPIGGLCFFNFDNYGSR